LRRAKVVDLEQRGPKETFNGSERPALSVRRLRWLTEAARQPFSTLDDCHAFLEHYSSKAELISPLGVRLRKALLKGCLTMHDSHYLLRGFLFMALFGTYA